MVTESFMKLIFFGVAYGTLVGSHGIMNKENLFNDHKKLKWES